MTDIVLVGVNRLRIKALFAFLVAVFYVFTDPNIPVQPKYQVNITR